MKIDILGVLIDNLDYNQAVTRVEEFLADKNKDRKYYIVTPNPEFIIASLKDKEFKRVLNKADLAIPDGVGLILANRGLKGRVTGIDLMDRICKMAAEKGYKIGLLGGRDKISTKCAKVLQERYPRLDIGFVASGGEFDMKGNGLDLKIPRLDILFVAFGQVKQEMWIDKNLQNIPVKVAMGVGGAFDYISGEVPRAPVWIQKVGFEWLFRLIFQPWRIKRQFALLQFIWKVMIQ